MLFTKTQITFPLGGAERCLIVLQAMLGVKWLRFIVQSCVVFIVFKFEWFFVVVKPVFKDPHRNLYLTENWHETLCMKT